MRARAHPGAHGIRLPRDVDLDLPRAVRAAPPARGAAHRADARLRHLRLVDQQSVVKQARQGPTGRRRPGPAAAVLSRSATPRTAWRAPSRSLMAAGTRATSRSAALRGLHRSALESRQRARLRRPAAEDGRALRGFPPCGSLQRAVPLRDGGRVPGHQPPAVPARAALSPASPQPLRRRRSRPVDLQVARGGPAEHPRLRARLPRSAHRAAGAQLPVDAGDSGRCLGRDQPEPATARRSGSGPTARAGHASCTSAAATSSKRPSSSRARPAGAQRGPEHVVAILYRTNAQSRAMEDAMRRAGMAYRIIGGVRLLRTKGDQGRAGLPQLVSTRTTT
jgi:hypothetical protein